MLQWKKLVAQERVKDIVGPAFENGTLGHAYLFCGGEGTGKFAAALDLAMALLCLDQNKKPCGECSACKKVSAYAHPDFHVIMPVVLKEEHKKNSEINEKGWQFIAETTVARIDDPYILPSLGAVPNIPVDWVREANHALRRGGTEGQANALIIDCVETMNKESANAMLKTLEEPPAGTHIILLTDKAHAVLPTIASRCQVVRFAPLDAGVIRRELARRFGANEDDARVAAAAMSGSLGIAIDEYENSREEYFRTAADLWNDCARGDFENAAKSADYLSSGKDAFSECRKILKATLDLLRAAILARSGVAINYFDAAGDIRAELPENVSPDDTEKYLTACQDALNALEARGNVMLVMVNFVCTLLETLNVEKR